MTPHPTREQETHPDAGMSVVEVLVATGLFMVLTTMIATVAILGMRTSTGMQVRLDSATQGDLGMAASSKVLRTAVLPDQLDAQACDGCAETAIVQATSTRVTFYANLDNTGQGPSLTTLEVIQDPLASGTAVLRQTTIPPTSTGDGHYRFCNPATEATCVVRTRTLARGLVWPTAGVFVYYDFDGARISGTSLGAADLPRVSSADITITVQSRPGGGYPTATMVQRVRLPNADINVLVEAS
jgi:hypothetical protein